MKHSILTALAIPVISLALTSSALADVAPAAAEDKSGCAVNAIGSRSSLAGFMLAAGAGLLLLDRRRKRCGLRFAVVAG